MAPLSRWHRPALGSSCHRTSPSACQCQSTTLKPRQPITACMSTHIGREAHETQEITEAWARRSLLQLAPAMALLPAAARPALAKDPAYETGAEKIDTTLQTYSDPESRFSCLRPVVWNQVQNIAAGIGIAASFYNPSQPGAETLAVYFKPTDAADTKALGTAQELGQQLADVAANGELQEAFSYSLDGRTYHVFRVEFGGGTAGRFGAAMEVRCVTVAKGVQYTLRVTTTRYRWLAYPEMRGLLMEVAQSFRVAATGAGAGAGAGAAA